MSVIQVKLAKPLELPNRVPLGANFHAAASRRKRLRRELAREIWVLLGCRLPKLPMARARVNVQRVGIQAPDQDNLHASVKALLDVLQPVAKNRAYGLGIIAGDDPTRLELNVVHVQADHLADQCTFVTIEDITSLPARATFKPASDGLHGRGSLTDQSGKGLDG
ncbi:MAG TPA: hypothetical protein PK231_09330 [Acidocella sp.]|nr:hypothetical protein [Acidocella sp.]HQU04209.1 hypothetical protein [Acidocella sp.]